MHYWYKITIFYCPVCGHEKRYRERIMGDKPKDPASRRSYYEYYDYCLDHI